jgi:predicted nucleic acid-binding protein
LKFVVDASVAVEFLLRTPVGQHAAATMSSATLFAPELLDAEVLAVLRRAVLGGHLDEGRAGEAIDDLREWELDRIRHRDLVARAWSYRHNATPSDALYLAAADVCGATVLTVDGPLSRIPLAGVIVHNVTSGR